GAAGGRRAGRVDGLDHQPGPRRGDPREQARGTQAARRGGSRARALQAATPPRRAQACPGRNGRRACARPRGRGEEASAPARSPERERLLEEARLARDRLGALERTLAELEGLPPAARALAEQGQKLVLSTVTPEAGSERAVAAALGWRAAAVIVDDARAGLE